MACDYRDIMLYWSGELSLKKREAIENHLGFCDSCRKMLSDLRAMEDIKELPLPKPGRDLVKKAVFTVKKPAKRRWIIPLPPVKWAGALLSILFAVYLLTDVYDGKIETSQKTVFISISLTERPITREIVKLRGRMYRIKMRMAGRKEKRVLFSRTTVFDKKLDGIRSNLKEIRTCMRRACASSFFDIITIKRRNI